MSPAGAPSSAASASAPGWLELSGSGVGPRLCVALDRRAVCRVEPLAQGVVVEAKESLARVSAGDAHELVGRNPGSLAAQVLCLLGAASGLRLVSEWKLPAGAGINGEAALALATTTAVAGALGSKPQAGELLELAREAAARAGLRVEHGLLAALHGGVVRSGAEPGRLAGERVAVDPGRVGESLLVVDAGEDAGAIEAADAALAGGSAALTGRIAEALAGGRYEDVVGLVAEESGGLAAGPAQRRLVGLVSEAGGAARVLGARLVAVWAPPGARGPGRREAVVGALKGAGLKPLAVRVDLRGLELD